MAGGDALPSLIWLSVVLYDRLDKRPRSETSTTERVRAKAARSADIRGWPRREPARSQQRRADRRNTFAVCE